MNVKFVSALVIISSVVVGSIAAQASITLDELHRQSKKEKTTKAKMKSTNTEKPVTAKTKKEKQVSSDVEFLAEGSYSKIEKPFVFVARDAETLASISSLLEDFKVDKKIDFQTHAVVAAFSGVKNTGGYSVSIKMYGEKCVIEDVAPAHGAIVTAALTKPYYVVKVPIEEQKSLFLEAGKTWTSKMDRYEITSGDFQYSGGFLGIERKFEIGGEIFVMKQGDQVSLVFAIAGKGSNSGRKLLETASGTLNQEKPTIWRIEGQDFYDRPHMPLTATVNFVGDKLKLKFTPGKRPYVLNDGFEGNGSFTAVLKPAP